MIFFAKIKNTTKKRTSKAPENICKTCNFISENAIFICSTYDDFVKNADVTKLMVVKKLNNFHNFDFWPKPPHASLKNNIFEARMRGFWPKVKIVEVV